jgi:hypothetical protein
MNPDFFKGTVLKQAAEKTLAADVSQRLWSDRELSRSEVISN